MISVSDLRDMLTDAQRQLGGTKNKEERQRLEFEISSLTAKILELENRAA